MALLNACGSFLTTLSCGLALYCCLSSYWSVSVPNPGGGQQIQSMIIHRGLWRRCETAQSGLGSQCDSYFLPINELPGALLAQRALMVMAVILSGLSVPASLAIYDYATCLTKDNRRCLSLFIATSLTLVACFTLTCGTWSAVKILYNNAGLEGAYTNFAPNTRYLQSSRQIYFTLGPAIYCNWTCTLTALTGALCLFFANCGRRNGETDHDSDVYMYGSHVSPPKYTPSIGEFKRTEYI